VPARRDGGHGALLRVGVVDDEGDGDGADEVEADVGEGEGVVAGAGASAGVGEGAAVIDGVCTVTDEAVVVGPAADVPAPEPQPVSTRRAAAVQTASERPRARRTPPWSTRPGTSASVEHHDVSTMYRGNGAPVQ